MTVVMVLADSEQAVPRMARKLMKYVAMRNLTHLDEHNPLFCRQPGQLQHSENVFKVLLGDCI